MIGPWCKVHFVVSILRGNKQFVFQNLPQRYRYESKWNARLPSWQPGPSHAVQLVLHLQWALLGKHFQRGQLAMTCGAKCWQGGSSNSTDEHSYYSKIFSMLFWELLQKNRVYKYFVLVHHLIDTQGDLLHDESWFESSQANAFF